MFAFRYHCPQPLQKTLGKEYFVLSSRGMPCVWDASRTHSVRHFVRAAIFGQANMTFLHVPVGVVPARGVWPERVSAQGGVPARGCTCPGWVYLLGVSAHGVWVAQEFCEVVFREIWTLSRTNTSLPCSVFMAAWTE